MISDGQLLRQYVTEQSDKAFAEIVRRHIDAIYSAARRRVGGDRALAEEVVQSVFLSAARKAEQLARHPQLSAWLYTATRHEASHAVRAERRRKAREQEAHTMADLERDPEMESADWRKLRPAIDAAIDELKEDERRVVLQRYFDRRSFAEVAAILGVSEDAARMRVNRALEKMREGLAKHGITSSAVALGVALSDHAVMAAPPGLAGTVAAATAASAPLATAGILAGIGAVLFSPGAGLVALILAALATAGFELSAARAARNKLDAARQAYAKAAADEARDQQKLAELKRVAAGSAKKPNRDLASGHETTQQRDPKAEGAAFLRRHPEVKDALVAYKYASMRSHYGPLWRSLGLNPDQIQKFEQIMYLPGFGRYVQDGNIQLNETDESDQMSPKARGQALRELLGLSGYEALKAYYGQSAARETAANLVSLLTNTDNPLTAGQAQQLTAVLAGEPDLASADAAAWAKITDQAQGILTNGQFEMLSSMRDYAISRRTMNDAAR